MPTQRDPERCRQEAQRWQAKAEALAAGEARDLCLTIADGYAQLVVLMEQQTRR